MSSAEAPPTRVLIADDDAISSVVIKGGLLETAPTNAVHVVMATISVAFAKELEKLHAAHGIGYVAAPVMGRPDVAAKGAVAVVIAQRRPDRRWESRTSPQPRRRALA